MVTNIIHCQILKLFLSEYNQAILSFLATKILFLTMYLYDLEKVENTYSVRPLFISLKGKNTNFLKNYLPSTRESVW